MAGGPDAVILTPPHLPFFLPEKLRPGPVLSPERETDPMPVRGEADAIVEEPVAGLAIERGAVAAAGQLIPQ